MSNNLAYAHGGVLNIDRRVPVIRQPCGHHGRTVPERIGAPAWCGTCYAERGEWVRWGDVCDAARALLHDQEVAA